MEMFYSEIYLLHIRQVIATIGVIVISLGAVRSIYQLFHVLVTRSFDPNYIRLQFGNCMVLGLEFMVGADIIGSLVAPDYYNLGMLGIIVIIRTVLSYFLTLELKGLSPKERKAIK